MVLLGPPDCITSSWPPKRGQLRQHGQLSFEYEVWSYRKVVCRGVTLENVELEFADPSTRGEYRLLDEQRKTFLRVPCM